MHSVSRTRKTVLAVLMGALLMVPVAVLADVGSRPVIGTGISRPSQIAELSFSAPGIIHELLVRDGDAVQSGQTLLVQDDRMEALLLDIAQLEADATHIIEASKADLASRKVALARVQQMHNNGVSTDLELEEATLAVDLADARLKQAEQEAVQKRLQADRQKLKVELMRLVSPINGIVEKIDASLGQVVDPSRPVAVVVQNDPLWVDVRDLNTDVVSRLAPGQVVEVQYRGQTDWHPAKIIFISPVADGRSQTHPIRLELPNPTGRAAGLRMTVRIAPQGAAVAGAQGAQE